MERPVREKCPGQRGGIPFHRGASGAQGAFWHTSVAFVVVKATVLGKHLWLSCTLALSIKIKTKTGTFCC